MKCVDVLNRVLGYLSEEIHPNIDLRQLRMFFLVASNEGITQTEIGEQLGLPSGVVSRNCSKLAQHVVERKKGPTNIGFSLIFKAPDADITKRNALYLTGKGKKVAEGVKEILGG